MNKMMTISMMALVSIALTACGSNSKKTEKTSDESEAKAVTGSWDGFSDAEKLAYAVATQNSTSPSTGLFSDDNSMAVKSSRDTIYAGTERCKNNGIIAYTFNETSNDISVDFQYCMLENVIQDGLMELTFDDYYMESGNIQFPEGFTVNAEQNLTIYPGGSMRFRTEGEYEVSVTNLEASINGLEYGAIELIYKGKYLNNGNYIDFPVSGQEKIGSSSYFTVDTSYDASQTPFTYDENLNMISGTARYLDDAQHSVELSVNGEIITVKVDENGDGTFSSDETSAIKLY